MNITISWIPNTATYDVWINSTRVILTRRELVVLRALIKDTLKD